jgi:Protein of unknown function (DUF2939)
MSTWRGSRAKERTRSRIVVSVDDERARGRGRRGDPDRTSQVRRRTSRRRRGALLVSAAVVVALIAAALVGFYVWYQSDKKSPTYSLALLADASRRNDRQEVDQLVDIDQVTRSLVPQVVARVTGRAPQQPNAANPQANAPAQVPAAVRRFIETNAGVLIPGARDAVRDALVQSIRQGVAKRGDSYPFFVAATAARFAADEISVQGDAATVSFKSNAQPVTLTMQRAGAGDRWRVVGVESDELAARIADNLSRGLPALGR